MFAIYLVPMMTHWTTLLNLLTPNIPSGRQHRCGFINTFGGLVGERMILETEKFNEYLFFMLIWVCFINFVRYMPSLCLIYKTLSLLRNSNKEYFQNQQRIHMTPVLPRGSRRFSLNITTCQYLFQ